MNKRIVAYIFGDRVRNFPSDVREVSLLRLQSKDGSIGFAFVPSVGFLLSGPSKTPP